MEPVSYLDQCKLAPINCSEQRKLDHIVASNKCKQEPIDNASSTVRSHTECLTGQMQARSPAPQLRSPPPPLPRRPSAQSQEIPPCCRDGLRFATQLLSPQGALPTGWRRRAISATLGQWHVVRLAGERFLRRLINGMLSS